MFFWNQNLLDPFEDQFEKRAKAKKERIAKNELQHLRNIARNMKGKGTFCSDFARKYIYNSVQIFW